MRAGESLPAALERAGVHAPDARAAAAALEGDFDPVNPHPGLALTVDLAPADGALVDLSLQPRPETRLTLWRGAGGRLQLRREVTQTFRAWRSVQGVVDGSLYLSLVGAGVGPDDAGRIAGQFGARLDLTRDVESGDRFRLLFEQTIGGGRRLGPAFPLYAELRTRRGETRLYRASDDARSGFFDGVSGRSDVLLLRTPVDAVRISSPFGLRLHPILGYTRMHEGVDFAAPVGAPVLAAGDGVVEDARWAGGYGRWLRIRHRLGLETAYAHLSAWAPGVRPGAAVRQGQVIGFVGASGLATGPHLHYEVREAGRPVDPQSVAGLAWLEGAADAGARSAVRARKAAIDAVVAEAMEG